MATTTETTTTTTARRGFPGLNCPGCGDEDTMRVNPADMSLTCTACENEYTADEIREMVTRWQQVLAWIELSPVID